MAQPTREQFDAAAAKVSASAPAGLTKDQFYALVDKELGAASAPAGPAPEQPSTSGFLRNVGSDTVDTLGGMAEGAGHAIAHPIDTITAAPVGILNSVRDLVKDIHPGEALDQLKAGRPMAAMGNLLPVDELYHKPVSHVADAAGAFGMVKGARALADLPKAVERSRLNSRVDRYMPNTSGAGAGGGSSQAAGEGLRGPVEPYMPNTSAAPGAHAGSDQAMASMIPDSVQAIIDKYMPNKGGNVQPGVAGADPIPPVVDKHMPNLSAQVNADIVNGHEATPFSSGFDRYMPNKGAPPPRDYVAPTHEHVPDSGTVAPKSFQSPDPQDAVYNMLMEKLGGGTEGKPAPRPPAPVADNVPGDSGPGSSAAPAGGPLFASPFSAPENEGRWHAYPDDAARAAADPAERARANELHKTGAELDDRYSYLTDPNNESSAFTSPEGLMAMVAREMVRQQYREFKNSTRGAGLIGKAKTATATAAKTGANVAVVGRLGNKQ